MIHPWKRKSFESFAEKQVCQFRNKYGIIKDVSDRLYVSNSSTL